LDRSYQANFFFILENELHDGTLVSSADIDQTPNVLAATYENAYLDVFDYRTMTSRLNVRFSVDSLERQQIPEPPSWLLALTAAGGLLAARRRQSREAESSSRKLGVARAALK
jgi:MYXO-CTERM domain-containing protein